MNISYRKNNFFLFFFLFLVLSFITVQNAFARVDYSEALNHKKRPDLFDCESAINACLNEVCLSINTTKNSNPNLYAKCDGYSKAQIYNNISGCLIKRSELDKVKYLPECEPFVMEETSQFIIDRQNASNRFRETKPDCIFAKKAEEKAEVCFNYVVNSDGSFTDDFKAMLNAVCGDSVEGGSSSMVNDFFNVGVYGDGNVMAYQDMINSNQTLRKENWRDIAASIFNTYKLKKIHDCGDNIYDIPNQTTFDADYRENQKMKLLVADAKIEGKKYGEEFSSVLYAKHDCLNQELPSGGIKWVFDEYKMPNCKVICDTEFYEPEGLTVCNLKKEIECERRETDFKKFVKSWYWDYINQTCMGICKQVYRGDKIAISYSYDLETESCVPVTGEGDLKETEVEVKE